MAAQHIERRTGSRLHQDGTTVPSGRCVVDECAISDRHVASAQILLNLCETRYDLNGIVKCILQLIACLAVSDQVFVMIRQKAWHFVWESRIKNAFGTVPKLKADDEPELHAVATAHLCKKHVNDSAYHLVTIGQEKLRFFFTPD